MRTQHHQHAPRLTGARRSTGFSLVELMVAMGLGLLLTTVMGALFLSSKTGSKRQAQLSEIQQSVRIAFDYLAADTRMSGYRGCQTGRDSGFNNGLSATSLATNYGAEIEGFEYTVGSDGLVLESTYPENTSTASNWGTNIAPGSIASIPVGDIAGTGTGAGLTPGSDVLVIRTAAGRPVHLTADTTANGASLSIENIAGGTCSNSSAKVSGFCPGSHGLVASCTTARVFSVDSIAGSTLNLGQTLQADPVYAMGTAEVIPMQTIAYYVKRSSSGSTTSLYRRVFDGDHANGLEEELIEGVESLQIRYGVDTSATPDGIIDAYATAEAVGNWSNVVSVRMGLLLRSLQPAEADMPVPSSGVVNGVTITYPSSGPRYDRRVFTTTVAIRNKIAYF